MANYLITGYGGEPHVTSENDRGINAGIIGAGRFILPVGQQFRAEYIGSNKIRMYDGKLVDNGAAAGIPAGEYIDISISTAAQGYKRNDLIVFQYSRDISTQIETGAFVILKGAETTGTPADPAVEQHDMLAGEITIDQMPMWRVAVNGATISAPEAVFTVSKALTNVSDGEHKHNASDITSGAIPVSRGGTGATTAADARSKLGITPANIGALPSDGVVGIGQGGTGASTAADARTKLGAAASVHTHTKADVIDFAHTHTKTDITDFAHTHSVADIVGIVISATEPENPTENMIWFKIEGA